MGLRKKTRNKLLEAVKELESAGYRVENVRKVKRGHGIKVYSGKRDLTLDDIKKLEDIFARHGYVLERPLFHEVVEGRTHMYVHKKKRLGIF
jgi:hypothetical protein